jgi:hypothetical protein
MNTLCTSLNMLRKLLAQVYFLYSTQTLLLIFLLENHNEKRCSLREGGRKQQPGSPIYNNSMTVETARRRLAEIA